MSCQNCGAPLPEGWPLSVCDACMTAAHSQDHGNLEPEEPEPERAG